MLLQAAASRVRRVADVVRWHEPWDVEVIDDPLDDASPRSAHQSFDLWA
ncbi:MAG TPA: hypothetical protein VEA78_01785 [Acidimicrobiales bacterium]|nr:hypothetical protein [Acidimicrobiales bacterium]